MQKSATVARTSDIP